MCIHCGSTRHGVRGCRKRLTCQRCGRKEHPSDKNVSSCVQYVDRHTRVANAHRIFFQFDPKVVRAHEACWNVSNQGGGDVKVGRSPGWNLARAECSRLCIYAFVEGQRKVQENSDWTYPIANKHNDSTLVSSISSVKRLNDYARLPVRMKLDLAQGELRGYGRYQTPGKWFKQAKATGKINRKPLCCLTLARKCLSLKLPLLVR